MPRENPDAKKFAEDFMRRYAETFRLLASHNAHPNNTSCYCYPEGNVQAKLGKPSVLGKR